MIKWLTLLLLIITINKVDLCQDNPWKSNLSGINNIYITVNLCPEEKDYDYLQYEIYSIHNNLFY